MLITRLTTIDNPYDPFSQFDDWYAYDEQLGYHTCEYLGRVTRTSNAFGELEDNAATESAINDIIRLNPGMYKRVTKDYPDDEELIGNVN